MVKGNKAIPHIHQRKHYVPNSSQSGNIKVFLDQPMRAQRRRRLRLVKAKRIFPRPLKLLRPTVRCPTVRYNMKKRLGRGFSIAELHAAKIKPRYAATIGIRVDKRRKNLSEEGLSANVQRLKSYLGKLVLFPRGKKASSSEQKNIVQDRSRWGAAAAVHPSTVRAAVEPMRALSADEKAKGVYGFLKKNISAQRFLGARIARAAKKSEKKEESAKK